MMLKREFVKSISSLSTLIQPLCGKKPGLRILNYHSVGGEAFNDERRLFDINISLFEKHVDLLNSKKIQLKPLLPLVIPTNSLHVSLTFDDGYLNNLKNVAPILIDRGIPFSVFVSANFVKNKVKGFLRKNDLIELSNLPGVTIGSHGMNHNPLISYNKYQIKKELVDSKLFLEDVTGREIISLAYPYGLVNNEVKSLAVEAGYLLGLTTRFYLNKRNQDPMVLNRFNIESDNTSRILMQKIEGGWDWYRWRSIF